MNSAKGAWAARVTTAGSRAWAGAQRALLDKQKLGPKAYQAGSHAAH